MAARVTPAVRAVERAGVWHVVHEYEHDPRSESFGQEAAAALGVDPARVFKTLVASVDGQLTVAIVPVLARLDTKALARARDAKRAELAAPEDVERATGYVLGGISPLGQRRRLPSVMDISATTLESMFVSGGRRGLELELAAQDVIRLTDATSAAIATR